MNTNIYETGCIYLFAGPPKAQKSTYAQVRKAHLAINKDKQYKSITVLTPVDKRNKEDGIKNHNGLNLSLDSNDAIQRFSIPQLFLPTTMFFLDQYDIIIFEEIHIGLEDFAESMEYAEGPKRELARTLRDYMRYLAYGMKKIVMPVMNNCWGVTFEPVYLWSLLVPHSDNIILYGKCDHINCSSLCSGLPKKFDDEKFNRDGAVELVDPDGPSGSKKKWGTYCAICTFEEENKKMKCSYDELVYSKFQGCLALNVQTQLMTTYGDKLKDEDDFDEAYARLKAFFNEKLAETEKEVLPRSFPLFPHTGSSVQTPRLLCEECQNKGVFESYFCGHVVRSAPDAVWSLVREKTEAKDSDDEVPLATLKGTPVDYTFDYSDMPELETDEARRERLINNVD